MTGDESLAALAGHNPDAQPRIAALLERYRREGISGLRAAVADRDDTDRALAWARLADDLVEAILMLSEARSPRITREAWAREEERAEIERETEGGGA